MTLEEAKQFIGYNVKEGVWDEDVIEGMTDQEIIEFAENESDRADAYANDHEEQEEITI